MVLRVPDEVRKVRRQEHHTANHRHHFNRPVQDRLMTDKVIEFPKAKTVDDMYDNMYALDCELTDLTTKAMELGVPIYSIVGVLQGQVHFLLALEAGEFDDDEE